MKLFEIIDDEPLVATLVRQRLKKGEKVIRYVVFGSTPRPTQIVAVSRTPKGTFFRAHRGISDVSFTIPDERIERYNLFPGKKKGTWEFTSRPTKRST